MHLEYQERDSLDQGSEQRAAEAASHLQLLIELLDTISERIFLIDRLGRVTFVNEAFLSAYGLTSAEVMGKSAEEILPDEIVSACQNANQSVFEQGEPICLETYWHDQDSDAKRWTETHKYPMRDSSGKITGIVGISRDITARRNAEEELKRQKALLEQVVETVPDQLFVKDRQRQIIVANRAFYDLILRNSDQEPGQDPIPALPPEVIEASMRTDTLVIEEGQSINDEFTFVDFEGAERCFEVRKLPLLEEGEVVGLVGLCRDLTDAKEAERQSKRNELLLLHASRLSSMGELAAGIAHEVNQPLFSILNYAKAIENKLQDDASLDLDAIREWVQQIKREATRGGKITQRLKSFAKPAETHRKPSGIQQIVLDSLEFMAIEARDAEIAIETHFAEGLPELLVDRIQIQQVLVNLLKNAIEACTGHSTANPRIVVATRWASENIEVSVADNGPGVATTDEANILDPFQTTKHDGIGLGLAISNTIIEAHQGQLTFHSNEWGGTTFGFALPVH